MTDTKHRVEKRTWMRGCFDDNCWAKHGEYMVGGIHEVEEVNWVVVDHEGWEVGGDVYETRTDAVWHAADADRRSA